MNKGIVANKKERITDTLIVHPDWGDTRIAEVTGTAMQTVKKIRKEMEESDQIGINNYSTLRDGRKYPRSLNDYNEKKNEILSKDFEIGVKNGMAAWPNLSKGEIRSILLQGRMGLLRIRIRDGAL